MKSLILSILIIYSLAPALHAQTAATARQRNKEVAKSFKTKSAVWINDTIYNAGKPFARMVKVGSQAPTYQVSTLNGKAVAIIESVPFVHNYKKYIAYKFVDNQLTRTAYLPYSSDEKDIATNLVQYNLVTTTGLNTAGVDAFLLKNPDPAANEATAKSKVDRDRTAAPVVTDNENDGVSGRLVIKQADTKIGTYSTEKGSGTSSNSKLTKYTIYFMDGTLCATIEYPYGAKGKANVYTAQDKHSHKIKAPASGTVLSESVNFLVRNFYL
jgi:hypothetical protein